MKFRTLLGKNADEDVLMLKIVYEDDDMGKTQKCKWFSRFTTGKISTDDKPRSGR